MTGQTLRIVLAGEWRSEIHEAAWATGLRALGHEVVPFAWGERFRGLAGRLQNRLLWGPAIRRLNADLLALVEETRPAAVIAYRATHLLPGSCQALRRRWPRMALVSYNNDDPFSPRAAPGLWRHYRRGLRVWDAALVYRHKNLADHQQAGARMVQVVRSAFLPERDHPVTLDADDLQRFSSEVLFAGHWEPDGRERFLLALVEGGIRVRLVGPEWERLDPAVQRRLSPAPAPRGGDYVKTIAGARIALCFLSRLNNDTYTRRCFEIPAIGTFLLCQRSADMEGLFEPGREAEYFSTPEELVAKVRRYLADEPGRAAIATAGHRKVHRAGHDIYSRMKEVDAILHEVIARRRAA